MENIKVKVSNILKELGISCDLAGYRYLREAIMLVIEDDTVLINGITKILYPSVAETFQSTPQRVERAIRHAVETVFNRGDYDLIDEIFKNTTSSDKGKATNSQFIAGVADYLLLQESED